VSVHVRPATAADAERVAEVQVRTWQSAYAHVFPRERLDELDATLGRRAAFWRGQADGTPPPHLLVAEVDGAVAGFASCGAVEGEPALGELHAIYVLREAWGRGAGQALMAEVVRLLREDGFAEAVLWVLEDNPRTRRFYERCGWGADGCAKEEEWLGTAAREVRYRIALGD
jgi:ribosomal protein S18 acetylase RimI-like enzyme